MTAPREISAGAPDPGRRDAMLHELLDAMERHHRRRQRRRRATAAGLAIVIVGALALVAGGPRAMPARSGVDQLVRAGSPPPPALVITMIETDDSVLDRMAPMAGPRTRVIDDGRLLYELAAAGRPTGLIRRDGRAWLASPTLSRDPG